MRFEFSFPSEALLANGTLMLFYISMEAFNVSSNLCMAET
jgi:hypothetical protein